MHAKEADKPVKDRIDESSSCASVRGGSCGECAQCLDDQVALGFCRRKEIDVLFCRSDVRVARWQSGNLFRQLACRPLEVESHGAVPFLLGAGPTTTWTRGHPLVNPPPKL